jgi:hypothetical protein
MGHVNTKRLGSLGVVAILFAAGSALACETQDLFGPHMRYFVGGPDGKDITIGDVDQDGYLDLVVATGNSGQTFVEPCYVSVLLSEGDGTFASAVDYYVGDNTFPHAVVLGAFDGDGTLDFAAVLRARDDVGVRLGNGDGAFGSLARYDVGDNPFAGDAGDLNGDGFDDLVVANNTSNTVSVLLSNGDGTFAPQTQLDVLDANDVKLADLDNDGHLDVVVVGGNDGNAFLGNGDGTFGGAAPFGVGSSADSVAVGDLNDDGILDLVIGRRAADLVRVHLGNGDGTFTFVDDYTVGNLPQDIALGDLDGDEDLDIVVVTRGDSRLAVLANNGDGTFADQVVFTGVSEPFGVAIADLDGDGDLDVAVSQDTYGDPGSVEVFLNQCLVPPTIIAQPAAVILATIGAGDQSFTVDVQGTEPVTYEWRFNGQPISDGGDYSGATTDTLTITPTLATEGTYDVVVTNGQGSVTSEPAVLGVINPEPADLNGDGCVDQSDLGELLGAYGDGC